MKSLSRIFFILPALFLSCVIVAQPGTYILNGSAIQNTCNCYTLTPAVNTQSGSVWNATKISLNNPFDFVFNVFLGCTDANGADGISFTLQPISTSVGTSGGGLGFEGISPSVGILLDTWQNINNNDPAEDHISINRNGNLTHGTDLAGPVQASPTNPNIEDCQWHTLRIVWDPVTKQLSTYFDGVFRLQTTVDLVTTVFNNDPMVYWGFSAATGGSNNLQQFCTALNPGFTTNLTNNTSCYDNTPVSVSFTNTSQSFAPITSFYWDFGNGNTSTAPNPPAQLYTAPGIYNVKVAITGLDGCFSDTLRRTITIGDKPVADFNVFDTCNGNTPRIAESSTVTVGTVSQWNWLLDGNPVSTSQLPQLAGLTSGPHQLQLTATSNHGCISPALIKSFVINPKPVITGLAVNGCTGLPVIFSGQQVDNATTIAQWNWQSSTNQTAATQNAAFIFNTSGNENAVLTATATNGCIADPVTVPVFINMVAANAGNDTVIIQNVPFLLQSSYSNAGATSGLTTFAWSPATGLDDATIAFPVTILQDDQTYYFTVTTAEGCVAKDTVNITVFKGSAVYVPTGFTPNNDGLNELLKPYYVGIQKLDYFTVYNRWGEMIFTTKDIAAGWDGSYKGAKQPTGTYVWVCRATDYAGKVYQLKGTSTIIR
jgi:gliding motility-associated-like protein